MFKKQPNINFHAALEGLEKICPILKSSKHLPEWWKKIDKNEGCNVLSGIPSSPGSVKKCPAITDFILNGFIMNLWTDLYIDPTTYPDPTFEPALQYGPSITINVETSYSYRVPKHVVDEYPHTIKIQSPWLAETTKGYSIYVTDPFYHFNKDFKIVPGIVDTDVYNIITLQVMLKRSKPFVIPFGTPIAHILPFKREKLSFNVLPKSEKSDKMLQYSSLISFSRFSASSLYNFIRKKNSCPFKK